MLKEFSSRKLHKYQKNKRNNEGNKQKIETKREIYPSCHIIPTLKGISTRDSFSCRRDMPRLERFLRKEMRIFRLHLILPFPRIFRSPVRVPPNLNDTDLAVTYIL